MADGATTIETTEATNIAAMRRTFEDLFTRGDLALADELVTADCVNHEAPPGSPPGPEGLRRIVVMLRTAFPDLRYTVEDAFAAGDRVAVRTTLHGTHLGPLMGLAPTGKPVRQEQMHIVRFVDGKGAEHWAIRDDLGLLRQLGQLDAGSTPASPVSHER